MRVVAFILLAWAALDGPAPFLDRVGLAALGLGFLALALPSRPGRIRRPAFLQPDPTTHELDDLGDDDELDDLATRIGAYAGSSAAR